MTTQIKKQKVEPVMVVSPTKTLLAIEPGTSATFDCRRSMLYSSACSVISRMNKAAGRRVFAISTDDNGATFTVTRFA